MLRTVVQSFLSRAAVAIINLLLLLISSRYLGINSRGEISVFLLNLGIVQILNEVYTGFALVYFIPRYNLKKIYLNGLVLSLFFPAIVNALLLMLDKHIPGFEWQAFAISFLLIMHSFHCLILLGKKELALFNSLSLLQPALLLAGLLASVFVSREYTFKAFVYPLGMSFFLASLVSLYFVFRKGFRITNNHAFRLLPILGKGLLTQASLFLFFFCNRYSFYLLPTKSEVGLYATACALTESVFVILYALSPLLLTGVSNEPDAAKARQMAIALSKICLLVSTISLLCLLLVPEHVFLMILGAEFAGIKGLILLYTPAVLMWAWCTMINQYWVARGLNVMALLNYGLAFVIVLFLTPALVKNHGPQGAAMSADIAFFSAALLATIIFLRSGAIQARNLLTIQPDLKWLRNYIFNEARVISSEQVKE
ncbi:MAG TPA: hypothetical protein PLQ93_01565 [Bacteroidia bacterium]|nr:hypothetical protein [Bacteroidia bacterium]